MSEEKKKKRKKKGKFLKRLMSRLVIGSVNKINFEKLVERIASSKKGEKLREQLNRMPEDWTNAEEIGKLATDMTLEQLREEGMEATRAEIEALVEEIRIRYDRKLHINTATAVGVIFDHLFDQADEVRPFTSPDGRDLAHLDRLKAYREEGLGVVYLINHSSHLDEFLVDLLWQRMFMGLPVFAAGQNMMVIGSLAKLLMIGSYVVLRKGASRHQMAVLYNYCRAISMSGAQQGIFLEAWRGGARTRDGSLRYPKRLVTLRGAIDTDGDVVIQPVAVSFSAVPEDLPLSSGKSGISWLRGLGFLRTLLTIPLHPKTFLWRAAENLYGRAFLSVPEPMLLSRLKEKHARDRSGISFDDFVALSAIWEIAKAKKVMASQVVARGLLRARKNRDRDLVGAVSAELSAISEYHLGAFGEEPDFEDFIRENDAAAVLADGLAMLKKRRVVRRFRKDPSGLPKVINEAALSYYATHADRRLYSPTADQNIVVAGAGNWGFAIAKLVGGRILEDRRYDNASLTIFDSRTGVVNQMGLNRHGPGRFSESLLPKNVFVTSDLPRAFRKASEVIIASKPEDFEAHLRGILAASEQTFRLMLATRGFIPGTQSLPYAVAERLLAEFGRDDVEIYTLAGPVTPVEFVEDRLIRGILAGPEAGLADLADLFNWPSVRLFLSDDPVGIETADILARVYAVWVNYVEAAGTLPDATEIGYLTAEAADEVRHLALMLGASPATFEAGSIPWTASFTALCREGQWRDFGRKAGAAVKRGKKPKAVIDKLRKQWEGEGIKLQSLVDMMEALACARNCGLKAPLLEEAVATFWSDEENLEK